MWETDIPTNLGKAICPSFFEWQHKKIPVTQKVHVCDTSQQQLLFSLIRQSLRFWSLLPTYYMHNPSIYEIIQTNTELVAEPEWQHSNEYMCRLRNIACDYQENGTTWWTDGQTKWSLCITMLPGIIKKRVLVHSKVSITHNVSYHNDPETHYAPHTVYCYSSRLKFCHNILLWIARCLTK